MFASQKTTHSIIYEMEISWGLTILVMNISAFILEFHKNNNINNRLLSARLPIGEVKMAFFQLPGKIKGKKIK